MRIKRLRLRNRSFLALGLGLLTILRRNYRRENQQSRKTHERSNDTRSHLEIPFYCSCSDSGLLRSSFGILTSTAV